VAGLSRAPETDELVDALPVIEDGEVLAPTL
jgi:hypothetical protein